VAPTADWPALVAARAADAAVSALGTTMARRRLRGGIPGVDLDCVVAFAAAARRAGARQMVTVSSVGADASSANFYLRIKGEMERALEALGFDRLDILRPGLLRGERGGDRRLGETARDRDQPGRESLPAGAGWTGSRRSMAMSSRRRRRRASIAPRPGSSATRTATSGGCRRP
jgi:hypothetical protein